MTVLPPFMRYLTLLSLLALLSRLHNLITTLQYLSPFIPQPHIHPQIVNLCPIGPIATIKLFRLALQDIS